MREGIYVTRRSIASAEKNAFKRKNAFDAGIYVAAKKRTGRTADNADHTDD